MACDLNWCEVNYGGPEEKLHEQTSFNKYISQHQIKKEHVFI